MYFLLCLFCCAAGFSAVTPPKKYTLSIACIFKNDADYLKEWIEYHRIVGVEHFYMLNNDSEDSYKNVLQPYIEQGIVTLGDWRDSLCSNRSYAWVFATQVPALEYGCNTLARHESTWVAFIDTDEFLVPVQSNSVLDILKNHNDEVGLAISWRVFGTSNVKEIGENQLMIEQLTRCTTPDDGLCKIVKSIAKTDKFVKFATCAPHYCDYLDGKHSLHLPKEEIVINHYMNRNETYFLKQKVKSREKIQNKKLSAPDIIEALKVGNAMQDDQKHIAKFIPELRQKMGYTQPK